MKKINICHMTSVHCWNDTRIFCKEASSLAKQYTVKLFAPANFEYKRMNNVEIIGLPVWKYRKDRRVTRKNLFRKIIKCEAEVFHFHDPELIFIGLFLKIFRRKKVIYDIHEDVKKQILNKEDISSNIKKRVLSFCYSLLEFIVIHSFDKIIVAGEDILEKVTNKVIINNYPIIHNFSSITNNRSNTVIFIGGVTKIRGVIETAKAIQTLNSENNKSIIFRIIGKFENEQFKKDFLTEFNDFVKFDEWMSQDELYYETSKAIMGVVLYLPLPNHYSLRSNKVFEYMDCAIPVIYSNFDDWKDKLDEYDIGLAVNPTDVNEISRAIQQIIDYPERAKEMGKNGKKTIKHHFNWDQEEKKLIDLYKEMIDENSIY